MKIEVNRADTFENWRVKCNQAFETLDDDNNRIEALEALVLQLSQKIGELTSLQTNAKDSLTNAINEISTRIDNL